MIINKQLLRQIILYGIIGGGSAFLDFILFMLMYNHLGMNEYFSNVISIHAGIAMSFTLNSKYNFHKTDKLLRRAISFYLTGLFGLALSQGLLWFGNVLLIPLTVVKFTSIFIVAAVQFIINKFVTFRKQEECCNE